MKWQPEEKKLSNGLEVVVAPMGSESVTVLLTVRVGSRDESKQINGLSHFVEHMVFKATKKWPSAMEMNKVIDSIGGKFNAFTSQETTGFWVKVAKKHLGLGIEFLYQAVFESLLPEIELERERGVILEEIKMRNDNPMIKVNDSFSGQIFSGTALGQQIIGTSENIKSLKKDDFVKHLDKWYQPGNMVLSIAGGVEEKDLKKAEEILGGIQKGDVSFRDKPEKTDLTLQGLSLKVINQPIKQAHFCLGVRTFEAGNKHEYELAVLNTILGGNTSSRLWNEIREKRGLVYYVRSINSELMDTGYLYTQAGCDLKRVEEAIKVTKGEYDKIASKGISDEELNLAKEYLLGRLSLDLEDSQDVASMGGESLLLEGKVKRVEVIIKGVKVVTKEEVRQLAGKIFSDDSLFLTVVGPFKNEERFAKLLV